jgi:glycosyltransferase involved in cell wall biosynthesis
LLPNEIRIVLIGLSEQQIRSLPAGIEGIRRTESIRELAQWYSRATALVCPTYSDTFPTTNLESLACGTPVVTYKTGGGPEALTPETGMVVERGNVSQIAQAILKLANSRSQERRRLCRQRAVEKFSATDRFADYVKLYDQILGVKSIAV